ncbi:hypothetical protein JXQ31_19780 [candidate division KSB1 bacterium]|nr:hypothetical protein [candidate division KSB1 bacterium]
MQKYGFSVLSIILCCFVLFCNVNKDPIKSEQPADASVFYLEFTDFGCQGNELNLDKVMNSDTYLKNYYFKNDTLTLRIHYSANCCPEFVDSVAVKDNVVEIALADTLRGCRCICDYDNDFSFLFSKEGTLRIIFKEWDIPGNLFTTLLDTTVTIIK